MCVRVYARACTCVCARACTYVCACVRACVCVCAHLFMRERERERKLMYGDHVHVSDQLKRSVVLNLCHCQRTNDQCLMLDHQWR